MNKTAKKAKTPQTAAPTTVATAGKKCATLGVVSANLVCTRVSGSLVFVARAAAPTTTGAVIAAQTFAVRAQQPDMSVPVGATASYTIIIDRAGGYRGPVTFTTETQDGGLTVSFAPNPTDQGTTLYLVTGPVSRIGRFDVTLRATGGGHSAPFSVVLQVTPPPPPSTSPPAATTTLPVIFNPGNSNVTQPTVQQPTVPSSQPNTSPTIRIGPS